MAGSSAGYFSFYEPEFNPTGLSGTVGGYISSTELEPKLGYLFVDVPTPELSDSIQFRKVYIKQEGQGTFQDVNFNIVNIEHTGQIHFVTGQADGSDSSESPVSYPTGAYGQLSTSNFSGNVDTPIYIGNTSQNEEFSVWIRQTIPAGSTGDPLATFSFKVKGTKIT